MITNRCFDKLFNILNESIGSFFNKVNVTEIGPRFYSSVYKYLNRQFPIKMNGVFQLHRNKKCFTHVC